MKVTGIKKCSINNIAELIETLESIRKEYGNLTLGNDNHWNIDFDVLPAGCLVGTKEDDKYDALDIGVYFYEYPNKMM